MGGGRQDGLPRHRLRSYRRHRSAARCPISAQTPQSSPAEGSGVIATAPWLFAQRSHLSPLPRTDRHCPENPVEVQVLQVRVPRRTSSYSEGRSSLIRRGVEATLVGWRRRFGT
jgi:hypothetical protein